MFYFYFNGYGYTIIDVTSLSIVELTVYRVFFVVINNSVVNILETKQNKTKQNKKEREIMRKHRVAKFVKIYSTHSLHCLLTTAIFIPSYLHKIEDSFYCFQMA